jgi:hypothetical protein
MRAVVAVWIAKRIECSGGWNGGGGDVVEK